MKRVIFFLTILLVSLASAYSQNVHSVYFLNEWSQRHTLNAAFAPEYGYFTLPVLGGIEMNFNTNTGMSNYIFPYNSQFVTFLHPSVDGQQFLNGLQSVNYFNQGLNLNLFSFGFYTAQKSFWSFDITLKENLNVNLPFDLFRLLKMGMANQTNVFDLKNLGIQQTNLAQLSLGYSRDINSKLRIGANAKLLLGLSSERINYSQFDITLSQNQYSINATGESLIMSDFLSFQKDANDYYDFTKINSSMSKIKPAGLGFAFDLGVTYKPIKKLTLAVAVNDIGSLKWNAASIKRGIASSNVSFTGFSNVDINNVDIQSQLDSLKTNLTNLVKFKEALLSTNVIERIPYTINVSAEYSIFGNEKHDILLGMLWQSYNSPTTKVNQLVGALTLKPFSWFTVSGTCEFLRKDVNRYGVALNFSPRWINLYIASDFVTPKVNRQFLPIDKINANLSIGGSFIIGKPIDSDKDGIVDSRDKCPDTPLGVKVDKKGCPVDSDGDGVPDYLDKCPDTPAAAFAKVDATGCPLDTDGDGVPDYLDKCPDTPAQAKGHVDADGCPIDTDKDGVFDYMDKCPDTPAGVAVDSVGCALDSDGDGVPDYLDLCPATPVEARGKVDKNGCPIDLDGDGVPDFMDKCPDTSAGVKVDKVGCPLDSDGDGIPDYLDKCPDTPVEARGMVNATGCPIDTDGDGVPDYLDKCPQMPGSASNNGCPEVKKEVKTLFKIAQQGVQFETGKSVIKKSSFVILNKIVQVLTDNLTYLIEIRGHTDNVGNPDTNLLLSQKRASAVRDYLIGKGIDEKRITSNGFGDTLPVASNKTAAGRKLNRRVEFVVKFEEINK